MNAHEWKERLLVSKDVGEGDVENEMGVDEIRMKGKEWSKGAFVTICYFVYTGMDVEIVSVIY